VNRINTTPITPPITIINDGALIKTNAPDPRAMVAIISTQDPKNPSNVAKSTNQSL